MDKINSIPKMSVHGARIFMKQGRCYITDEPEPTAASVAKAEAKAEALVNKAEAKVAKAEEKEEEQTLAVIQKILDRMKK